MKTIVEVDNKQYVRDVIVYNSETQEPLVVTDSTPLLYLQRRGFKNIKTKEIPETWEELKDLCKGLKELSKGYIVEVFDDAIFVLDSKVVLLKVYDDGEIKDSGSEVIGENRTPAQMWQIIKNLIGEE